jgi:hypothetical protein
MSNEKEAEKVLSILKEYKLSSNKDLEFVMEFIHNDFEKTKNQLVLLTHHLDKLENNYNTILKEYQSRSRKK